MKAKLGRAIRRALLGERLYPLQLSDWSGEVAAVEEVVLQAAELHSAASPRFAGAVDPQRLPTFAPAAVPSVKLLMVNDVSVYGSTPFFTVGKRAVFPSHFNLATDIVVAEIAGRARVSKDSHRITYLKSGDTLYMDQAISLLGEHTYNYAHWLLEMMTRAVLIEGVATIADWPILVDDTVSPRLLGVLKLVIGERRKIVKVRSWQKAKVGRLAYVTPAVTLPSEPRTIYNGGYFSPIDQGRFLFSGQSLEKLRETIISELACKDAKFAETAREAPSHVFLERAAGSASNGRLLLNSPDLLDLMKASGFTVADTGCMEFAEQVALLSKAKVVVSVAGGSTTNVLFAPAGCEVIILTPGFETTDFGYFSNLMNALGHSVTFVVGSSQLAGKSANVRHSDFTVDMEEVRKAVAKASANGRQMGAC